MDTSAELERRLQELEAEKLDRRFGLPELLAIGILGLAIPIGMIVVGWGLGS